MPRKSAERWIVEVRNRHGIKVSRRYFDSEAEAAKAVETRHKNNRAPHGVRMFRAPALALVRGG